MVKRALIQWLCKVEERPQIVHLYGMRQTGKTTLMNEFRKRHPGHLHYPLQDYIIFNRYRSHVERWIYEIKEAVSHKETNKKLHVFVDEVQKIPELFMALQGLYDTYKGRIKFWIWGSSARPLKKKRAETLAGRFISRTLYPLSQAEFFGHNSRIPLLMYYPESLSEIDFQSPDNYTGFLNKCFLNSMLPEPLLLNNNEEVEDLLESYQASYLENEIRRENLVSDIGVYDRFIAIAASENTTVLNYSSPAKDLGVSSNTVKTWHDILKDTFITSHLNPYSSRFRVQLCRSPKVYFTDTGLARFIAGERGVPPVGTSAFGTLFESFVYNEILKQKQYQHCAFRLSFLRTKTGKEVDLLLTEGGRCCAIEIKCKQRITSQDYRGLQFLMNEDPSVSHGIVISLQGAPLQLEERIYNMPAWNL